MPCLVCGKRIPLLLQLSRSQFCSEAHEEQHQELQQKQIIARLTPPPPRFSIKGPIGLTVSLQEWTGRPPQTDFPIHNFQHLILCRQFLTIQSHMGVKCANTVSAFPRDSPPGAARAIGVSTHKSLVEQRLSPANRATQGVARRLRAASLAGVSAQIQISDSSRTIRRSVTGFKDSPIPAKAVRRLSIGSFGSLPAPAALRALQDALPVGFETLAPSRLAAGPLNGFGFRIAPNAAPTRSNYARRAGPLPIQYRGELFAPLDSTPSQPRGRRFEPYPFPVRLGLFALGKLSAPGGLRALQDALPVWLDTPAPASRSAAGPVLSFSFGIALNGVPPNRVNGTRRSSLGIQYRGESFEPLDSALSRRARGFEPSPRLFPASLELFTAEGGRLAVPPRVNGIRRSSLGIQHRGESFEPLDSAPSRRARGFELGPRPFTTGVKLLTAEAGRLAVPPNRVNGIRRTWLGIQYRGKSFEPLDSAPIPRARGFELSPRPFPASLELFTAEGGRLAAIANDSFIRQGVSGLSGPDPAGFALEEKDPPMADGFSEPLFLSCDFPLCPVWLPALFDEVGGMLARLRQCVKPAPVLAALPSCEDLLPADGPGFSGSLRCPRAGAAIWDRKIDAPEQVSVPEPVLQPAAPAEPAQTAPQARPEAPGQSALRFWRQAPRWVRCAALAVPLIVSMLVYSPSISLQSKSASAGAGSWGAAIKARATIDLRDEFEEGFQAWNGKPGWQKNWAIERSGSAQPGQLALFTKTIPLTDYRFEFQGQILSKALGMALRAADTSNYQAVKLVVSKPSGGLSTLTLRRYAVIEGREGPKAENPIPLSVRSDTLYKVLVSVEADHFQVTVNGVFADAWTDDRFKSGGIGFFAEKGEVANVRTVHVIDKEDFLGWLCYQVSQWTADRKTTGEKDE